MSNSHCPNCGHQQESRYIICTGPSHGSHYVARVDIWEIICAYSEDKVVTIITRDRGELFAGGHTSLCDIEVIAPHLQRTGRSALIDPKALLGIDAGRAVLKGTSYRPLISRRTYSKVRRIILKAAA